MRTRAEFVAFLRRGAARRYGRAVVLAWLIVVAAGVLAAVALLAPWAPLVAQVGAAVLLVMAVRGLHEAAFRCGFALGAIADMERPFCVGAMPVREMQPEDAACGAAADDEEGGAR